jgi:hypothetical protein
MFTDTAFRWSSQSKPRELAPETVLVALRNLRDDRRDNLGKGENSWNNRGLVMNKVIFYLDALVKIVRIQTLPMARKETVNAYPGIPMAKTSKKTKLRFNMKGDGQCAV